MQVEARAKADKAHAEHRIAQLEAKIVHLSNANETLASKNDTLEIDMARVFSDCEERASLCQNKLDTAQEEINKANQTKNRLGARISSLEAQVLEMQVSAREESQKTEVQRSAAAQALAASQMQTKTAHSRCQQLQKELEFQNLALADVQAELERVTSRGKNEATFTPGHDRRLSLVGEFQPSQIADPTVAQGLSEVLDQNRRLEQENLRLSARVADAKVVQQLNTLLKEEKKTLKAQIERLQESEARGLHLEALVHKLKDEKLEFATVNGVECLPMEMKMRYEQMSLAYQSATEKLAACQKRELENPERQHAIKLKRELQLESERADKERKLRVALEGRLRVEQLRVQLSESNDSENKVIEALEQQLDQLTAEFKARPLEKPLGKPDSEQEKPDSEPPQKRLHSELEPEKRTHSEPETKVENLSDKLFEANQRAETQMIEHEGLRDTEVFQLVEVKGSPYAQAVGPVFEKCALLEEEVKVLRQTINGSSSSATVPVATLAVISTELENVQAKLEDKHRQEQRILEVFQSNTNALRVAELELLGYKLDVTHDRTCFIQLAYDANDEDSVDTVFEVLFDPISREYSDLSFTPAVQPYASLYRYWVKEQLCIPGFLAAVFLENFEKYGVAPRRRAASHC